MPWWWRGQGVETEGNVSQMLRKLLGEAQVARSAGVRPSASRKSPAVPVEAGRVAGPVYGDTEVELPVFKAPGKVSERERLRAMRAAKA